MRLANDKIYENWKKMNEKKKLEKENPDGEWDNRKRNILTRLIDLLSGMHFVSSLADGIWLVNEEVCLFVK